MAWLDGLLGVPPQGGMQGLLGPTEIQQMQQRGNLSLAAALLEASGKSAQPVNLGQAFARGLVAKQSAQDAFEQDAMRRAQYRQAIEAQKAQQARQQALRQALQSGNIEVAAAIDPQAANAFRQATAQAGPETQVVDGVLYERTPQGWVPQTSKTVKPDLKPIYGMDGSVLGEALIDTNTGVARVGQRSFGPGQYTTQKPDENTVKQGQEQKNKMNAWNTYKEARFGLLEGLKGTTTGPVVGRMPSFFATQQIAEGSVAAMAPVLKQIFRVSGEGVFTDKDQQLLLDMVPKRSDEPEARAAKIKNIDRIIMAKLGVNDPLFSSGVDENKIRGQLSDFYGNSRGASQPGTYVTPSGARITIK